MSLTTIFDEKWHIPVCYSADETFEPTLGYGERYRMIFIEVGSGIVSIEGFRCAFLAPCLLCISENERVELVRGSGVKARSFYFHPLFVNSAFSFDNLRSGDEKLSVTDNQDRIWLSPFFHRTPFYHGNVGLGPASARRIAASFDGIEEQFAAQPDYSVCRMRSFLLEMLFMLARTDFNADLVREQPLPEGEAEIDTAIILLHTQYHRKITLEEISRTVHLSRTTLSERFSKATGQPVMSYLISLRVRLAAVMLRETNLPVSEIMERVGFSNSSHFIRTFRKFTNMSPSDYRAEHLWMLRTS